MKKQPIVFDLDGTLTSERYNEDNLTTLQENPTMMLLALAMQAERPLVVSTARPEKYMDQTQQWLASHGLIPDAIFMRPSSQESLPDAVVKLDHLHLIRAMYGDPLVWVDDNDSNVEMLQKNKVPVIHVKQ